MKNTLTRQELCYLRLLRIAFAPKRSGKIIDQHDADNNWLPDYNEKLHELGYIKLTKNDITLTDKAFKKNER